jgi:hypothetical protein
VEEFTALGGELKVAYGAPTEFQKKYATISATRRPKRSTPKNTHAETSRLIIVGRGPYKMHPTKTIGVIKIATR